MKTKYLKFNLKPVYATVLLAFAMQTTQANPLNPTVVNGGATFATTGNVLTVTNTPGAIINWQGFSIGASEITRFAQQSASSAVLNRVTGGAASNILGTLQSNGRVFLVNPSGIIFGAGSTVDVAGLVASSLNMSNADFMAGRYSFTQVPGAANISNAGNISAQSGGQIFLIAPNVSNTGVITAPNGEILLAAGHSVDLVSTNNPNLRVNITAPAGEATNVGQLIASSGSLGLFGAVVRNSGQVSADSVASQGGKIVFKASGRTEISGNVSANGTAGGTIQALGNEVLINAGATLNASGTNGGGTVLVGGDAHGANLAVPNALNTFVDASATIKADATQNGNGGKVVVWSDKVTQFNGHISAQGGLVSGNGGWVEVSGKQHLGFNGLANTLAVNGLTGTLLLDPMNITISTALDTVSMLKTPAGVFADATALATSNLNTTTLQNQLALSNVTVDTTSALGTGAGNITVQSSIAWASAFGLTLNATGTGSIIVNATDLLAAPLSITNTGLGGISLISANNITVNGALSTLGGNVLLNANATGLGGAIVMNTGSSITSNGGAITLGGGVALNGTGNAQGNLTAVDGIWLTGATLNSGAGNITLNGKGYSGAGTNQGILLTGSTLTTASGIVTLNGTGDALAVSGIHRGVRLSTASTISTGTGNINLTGTAGFDGDGVNVVGGSRLLSTSGLISVTGAAGNGVGADYGVWLSGIGTQISSGGNISISGNSTAAITGLSNRGLSMDTSALVLASGAATVSLTGTGGRDGDGVVIQSGSTVQSALGLITITGTSGNGPSVERGVNINGTGTSVSSGGGLTITGTSTGTTGSSNDGIAVRLGARVANTAGLMSLTGTAGLGLSYATLLDSSVIDAAAGLNINGTGGVVGTGRLSVLAGTLNFAGSSNGIFDIAGGALVTRGIWNNLGTINMTAGSVDFQGTFAAANLGVFTRTGGTVNLGGTYTNTAATLDIGSAGLFKTGGLNSINGTIMGGTLVNTDLVQSVLTANNGTLNGVTLGSNLSLGGGMNIANNLILATGTTLNLNGSSLQFTTPIGIALGVPVAASVTTPGTAIINMAGGSSIYQSSYPQTLTLGAGVTLKGSGVLHTNFTGVGNSIVNNGIIDASVAGQTLTITGEAYTNNGTMRASLGNLSVSTVNFTNSLGGIVSAAAGTALNITPSASLTNAGTITLGGTAHSLGSLAATLWSNTGTIALNAGSLDLGGALTAASLNTLNYTRLAGTTLNLSGTYTNTAATLDVGSAGIFKTGGLNSINGTIMGGTLVNTDLVQGTLTANGGTLNGVTLGSNLSLGGWMNISNNLILATGTTLNLNGSLDFTTPMGVALGVPVAASITTPGTAIINMAGGSSIYQTSYPQTLTLGAGLTVQGSGVLHTNWSGVGNSIVNNGIIDANVAGQTLTLTGESFTNNGTMRASLGNFSLSPVIFTNTLGGIVSAAAGTILNVIASSSFTNAGTITLGGASHILGGANATVWSNTGTIALNTGSLDLGGALTAASLNTLNYTRLAGTTVNLSGTYTNTAATLDVGSAGLFKTGGLNSINGTIMGGTLVNTDLVQGTLISNGGAFNGVTLGSNLTLGGWGTNIFNNLILATGTTLNLSAGGLYFNTPIGAVLGVPVAASITTPGTAIINMASGAIYQSGYPQTLTLGLGLTVKGSGVLHTNSNAGVGNSIINNGIIDASVAGQYITLSGETFTNNGTLRSTLGNLTVNPVNFTNSLGGLVSAGVGSTLNIVPSISFVNAGSVTLGGATHSISGGWTNTGTVALNAGSLDLGGSLTAASLNTLNYTRLAGTTVNLSGTYTNTAATLDVGSAGVFKVGGLNSFNGTILGGTLINTDLLPTALNANWGTLNGVTIGSNLTLGGAGAMIPANLILATGTTLNLGASGLYFNTPMGTVLGAPVPASISTPGTATITMAGGSIVQSAYPQTLTLGAGLTVNGFGTISSSWGATRVGNSIVNNGIIDATVAGQIMTLGGETLTNNGTLRVSGGTMTVSPLSWGANLGAVNMTAGALNLSGSFTTASLGVFTRTGGAVNLLGTLTNTAATLDIGSAGVFKTGGLNTLSGTIMGGTLINTDVLPTALTASFGTLDGVILGSNLTLGGSGAIIQNNLVMATGTTLNLGASNLYFNTPRGLMLGTPVATGITTPGTATITMAGGSIVQNSYPQTLTLGAGLTVNGYGNISSAWGANLVGNRIVNNGVIDANVAGMGLFIGGEAFTNNGTLRTSEGNLTISPASFSSGVAGVLEASVNATGTRGNITMTGPVSTPTLNLNGGIVGGNMLASGTQLNVTTALNINTQSSLSNITLNAQGTTALGSLANGAATLELDLGAIVNNSGAWTMANGSSFIQVGPTVAAFHNLLGGTLSVGAGNTAHFAGAGLTNLGTLNATNLTTQLLAGTNVTAGFGTLDNAAVINNSTVTNITGMLGNGMALYPLVTFINSATGTILFNDALGVLPTTVPANIAVNNNGLFNILAGTLTSNGTYTGSAGSRINIAAGATLSRPAGFTNSGILSGKGTIIVGAGAAGMINQGTINPGGAGVAGTLSITGDLQLGANSVLNIDMGGIAAGLSDKLAVTGNITMGGTVNAALLPGFVPVIGNAVPFMSMTGTAGGTFATVNAPVGFNAGYNLALGEAARMIYAGVATTATFTNAGATLDWANPLNWSTGVLPGTLDTALISAGLAVTHTAGVDSIAALTINALNSLNVSGGSLAVSGITTLGGSLTVSGTGSAALNGALLGGTSGQLSVAAGTLSLGGAASVNGLNLTGGLLNGNGSLTVTNNYAQTLGTLGNTYASINITQALGNLAVGSMGAVGAVNLTSTAGMLTINGPVTGASINGQSAAGVTLAATGTLNASGAGNAIVLNAGTGNFINNAGATALTSAAGRWLVYSANPALDTFGGLLSGNLALWGKTSANYAPAAVLETGNRYLFSTVPLLNVSVANQVKTYGTNLTPPVPVVSGLVNAALYGGAFVQDVTTGVASLSSAGFAANAAVNAGLPYAITVSAGTLAAPAGYGLTTYTNGQVTVNPFALTVSATGVNRVYNGTNLATVTLADNRFAWDTATLATSAAAATFLDKNVANAKAVSVTGIGLAGAAAGNYTFNTTAATTANITPAVLTVAATGVNRVYDATTLATVMLADNRIAGDVLTTAYTTASFLDKNAGLGKAVSVSGISLAGVDALNYTFNTTAATTANIAAKALTVTGITAANKVYDGTAVATINTAGTLYTGLVAGDLLGMNVTGAFADKNAAVGKVVTLSSSYTGVDAANYLITGQATTAANITPAVLTVGATGINKVYDATMLATVTLGDNRIAGDVLTTAYTTASFANKNAGLGKAVSVSGISIAGVDAGNYTFNTTAATTANITPAVLTVAATGVNKVYDATTTATVALTDNRIAGDVLTMAYTGASFADVNVAAGKPVSVTGISLSGVDALNYTFNTTAATTASISMATATWMGGNGLWSNAANWTGGLIPATTNMSAVIPLGSTVTYDLAAGVNALSALNSLGGFTMTGGTLNVAGAFNTAQYVQSAGSLTAGSVSISNAFSQTGGSLVATAGVTLNTVGAILQSAPGSITAASLTASGVGGISLNGANRFNALSSVTNTVSGNVSVFNTAAPLTLGNVVNGVGSVLIDNIGAIVVSGVSNSLGRFDLVAHSPITVNAGSSITSGGALTLTAGSAGSVVAADIITLNGAVSGTTVTLAANSVAGAVPAGAILQTPVIAPAVVAPVVVPAVVAPQVVVQPIAAAVVIPVPVIPFNPPVQPVLMQAPVSTPAAPAADPTATDNKTAKDSAVVAAVNPVAPASDAAPAAPLPVCH